MRLDGRGIQRCAIFQQGEEAGGDGIFTGKEGFTHQDHGRSALGVGYTVLPEESHGKLRLGADIDLPHLHGGGSQLSANLHRHDGRMLLYGLPGALTIAAGRRCEKIDHASGILSVHTKGGLQTGGDGRGAGISFSAHDQQGQLLILFAPAGGSLVIGGAALVVEDVMEFHLVVCKALPCQAQKFRGEILLRGALLTGVKVEILQHLFP